jgi:hypothetical protein
MKDTPSPTKWGLKSPNGFKSTVLREEEGPTYGVLRLLEGRCSVRMILVVFLSLCIHQLLPEAKESSLATADIPKDVEAKASSISPGQFSEIVRIYESMLGLHAETTVMTT